MIATLDHTEDVGRNIRTFWFRPERQVRYTAGQFTELYLPHHHPDDRGERRWFTISSSPTDPLLSITTKLADGRRSTFKETLFALPLGSQVSLADPMGDFVLPKDKSIPLFFVAGGMGITPMHSMIKYLADTGEKRPITLLYGVRDDTQLLFRELFESYDMTFMPIAEYPTKAWKGEVGGITAARVISILGDNKKPLVYLSGSKPLIEALAKDVEAYGIAGHRILTDFFPGYSQF